MKVSLHDIYRQLEDAGEISADPAQLTVLPMLELILVQLQQAPVKKGLLGGFFGKPQAPIKGLYLWGGVGRGKSFLMDLFYDHVPVAAKRRVHFHAFMQEIHTGMHMARQRGVDDALRPVADAVAAETRVLCFDEMQITDITDAMIVGRLFEALFAAGVVIITTSNRPPQDLYKDGLNRGLFLPFIDLIEEKMTVHQLASDTDYRQNRLQGSQVYFHPANAEARAEIDQIWADLTGGSSAPLELTVKGRQVELPAFHNGVARVPFWALCGQPLGPADYLAVAEQVRVLILEDIPLLGRTNFNEARRFVTLIDTVYEAKIRLIASAADIPERLYVEGEGTFEFERTASRLREMQSQDWATI